MNDNQPKEAKGCEVLICHDSKFEQYVYYVGKICCRVDGFTYKHRNTFDCTKEEFDSWVISTHLEHNEMWWIPKEHFLVNAI